jgi:hypothetical protein
MVMRIVSIKIVPIFMIVIPNAFCIAQPPLGMDVFFMQDHDTLLVYIPTKSPKAGFKNWNELQFCWTMPPHAYVYKLEVSLFNPSKAWRFATEQFEVPANEKCRQLQLAPFKKKYDEWLTIDKPKSNDGQLLFFFFWRSPSTGEDKAGLWLFPLKLHD